MSIQLHCTRSKIFVQAGSRPIKCGRNETTSVPDWVQDTLGYKHGIADKSIIDLTPGSGPVAVTVASDEVTALRARVAELEAQLRQTQEIPADEDDDPTGDKAYGNGELNQESAPKSKDATSVVDLSTAESTGAAAEGVSEPKAGRPGPVPAAKGLQGGRRK